MPQGAEPLLVELLAIFVSAKVIGEIFERLRLPSVLGEILAGIVLGPYALHWISSPAARSIRWLNWVRSSFYFASDWRPAPLG
jgi:Kef-type K+ transport system membrane component KefB